MLPTRNLDRAGKITASDSRPWRTQSLTVTCFLQDRLATIRKLCHGTRSVPDQRNPSLHNQRASRRLRGNFKLKKKVDVVMILLLKNSEHHFPRKGSRSCQLLVILHLEVFEVSLPKPAHIPPAGSSILPVILSPYSTAFPFILCLWLIESCKGFVFKTVPVFLLFMKQLQRQPKSIITFTRYQLSTAANSWHPFLMRHEGNLNVFLLQIV